MSKALLIDVTRCVGCGYCVDACHYLHDDVDRKENELSAHTFTKVEKHGEHFVRRLCMHCQEPACVSVCPVAALQKTPEGPVTYDADRCMGCRYCMMACPYQVPKYEWDSANPRIRKCIMCFDRLEEGKLPGCARVCRLGATTFGERDELLVEARKRIRENPDVYHPHIWGEKELGGTSVLYLSPVPFAELGLPTDLEPTPLPRTTWEVLSKLPNVVGIGAVALLGVSWVIHRRMELMGKAEEIARENGEEE
jgi:formate dehydrogenase iron-sulfur subunit